MSDSPNLAIKWLDSGREPKCAPDPRFPNGVEFDASNGAENSCQTSLPYPAQRCGYYLIECALCKNSVLISTAGRVDDPKHIKIPCLPVKAPGDVQ